jgi:hypothetical protein
MVVGLCDSMNSSDLGGAAYEVTARPEVGQLVSTGNGVGRRSSLLQLLRSSAMDR